MSPQPRRRPAHVPAVDVERVEVILDRLSSLAQSFDSAATVTRRIAESFKGYVKELRAAIDGGGEGAAHWTELAKAKQEEERVADSSPTIAAWMPPSSSSSPPGSRSGELDGAASALMNVLACKHPDPISRRELAHRAVYAPKSRHLGNVISSMRVAKFIEDAGDRELVATEDGLQSHGEITPLLNPRQLVDAWRTRKLSGGAGTILQILSVAKGGKLKKSEIAERSGYVRTSRHFGNLLSELRSAEIIEGKSVFQLAPWFIVVGGES